MFTSRTPRKANDVMPRFTPAEGPPGDPGEAGTQASGRHDPVGKNSLTKMGSLSIFLAEFKQVRRRKYEPR